VIATPRSARGSGYELVLIGTFDGDPDALAI
jgi:hypothetical protein